MQSRQDPTHTPVTPTARAVPASRTATSPIQLKTLLQGRSFDEQERALAPVQRKSGSTSDVVQMKNLTQAGKDGGLAKGGKAPIMNQPLNGYIYSGTAGAATDRTNALQKASELSATVGQRIEGMDWTRHAGDLDKMSVATMDPFHLKVTVPFQHNGKAETLELTYQHANAFMGYVTAIKDSSNPDAKPGTTMFTPLDKGGTGPLKSSDKFSNVHDTKDQGNIANMTEGGDEKNLDAYTKIAGEGARWQCVRKHASNLTNDTLFFTAIPSNTGQVQGVTFRALWLSWKSAFDRKYNIPDADVVAAITGGAMSADRRVRAKSALTTKDYDLDAGKSYSPTPPSTGGTTSTGTGGTTSTSTGGSGK